MKTACIYVYVYAMVYALMIVELAYVIELFNEPPGDVE